jgi:hypothetical protein
MALRTRTTLNRREGETILFTLALSVAHLPFPAKSAKLK